MSIDDCRMKEIRFWKKEKSYMNECIKSKNYNSCKNDIKANCKGLEEKLAGTLKSQKQEKQKEKNNK